MKWHKAAEEAVLRVPFFVRKRVRGKVEEEARWSGSSIVLLEHVPTSQKGFLRQMEEEVKGCRVETCFGPGGCPNRAAADDDLPGRIEESLDSADLKSFLKTRVSGPLKIHHEFRVSLSDCPNACSRPQIADLGLIGARKPRVSDSAECDACRACVEACREEAVSLTVDQSGPVIDPDRCLYCGRCIQVCPTGAFEQEARGYRILVGGRLGRHPRLASELEGIHSPEEVLSFVKRAVSHFKQHNRKGERFGDVLNRTGLEALAGDE